MRKPTIQHQFFTGKLSSVTNADNFQFLRIAFVYATCHIGNHCSGQAMKGSDFLIIRNARNADNVSIQLNFYFITELLLKLTLRSFYYDLIAGINLGRYVSGKLDRKSAYS